MIQLRPESPEAAPPVRRVELAGVAVDYRLVRARRRTIGMEIDLEGLKVRAPRWVTIREIEDALRERARWILRTLEEWRARRRDTLPRRWTTGATIVLSGRDLTLGVYPSRQRAVRADLFDLTVLHPSAGDEGHVAAFVGQWLREEAARLVVPHAQALARALGREPSAVKISNARSEWGSCNQKGVIRLNWRLVQLPPELAHYVVAHEVAHLAELNHSARFWNVVGSMVPDYAERRRALGDWTALLCA